MTLKDRGPEFDDHLPKLPELTEEALREADEIQARRAKAHPGGDRTLDRANAIIGQLDAVDDLSEDQKHLLAEALADTGRFDKAYVLTGNDYYYKVWKAIHQEDDKECGCSDMQTTVLENGQPRSITHSRYFTKRLIYSPKHNQQVRLQACNICGFLQAKP